MRSCTCPAPKEEFEDLALQLWSEQSRCNPEYGRWSDWVLNGQRPQRWQDIPAVPVTLFRTLSLTCFPPFLAKYQFKTSGTTGPRGVHHLMDTEVYDVGAEIGRNLLVGDVPECGVSLVSSGYESSLGHMCRTFAPTMAQCFIPDLGVLKEEALERLRSATEPQFVPATAFAMASLLQHITIETPPILLPLGSVIMITGGFKGRQQEIPEEELHQRLYHLFPNAMIVGEYGMSELSSQMWSTDLRSLFKPPPWLRVVAVDPLDGQALPHGTLGQLKFVDLANHQTVLAIETRDQGIVYPDGSLKLMGRLPLSDPRGCSLSVEEVDSMFIDKSPNLTPPAQVTKAFISHTRGRHLEPVVNTLRRLQKLPSDVIQKMGEGLSTDNSIWGWQNSIHRLLYNDAEKFNNILDNDYAPQQITIILARGVFTAGLEWVALALASGASVHVKVPSESLHTAGLWLTAFQEAELPLSFSNQRELPESDLLWIFGDDESIQSIQTSTAHNHCQSYGHRFSLAITGDSEQDAKQIALDIAAYDTRGCMAPSAIFCNGDVKQFCERVFDEMRRIEMVRPIGQIDPFLGPEIRRRIGLTVQRNGCTWLHRDVRTTWGVLQMDIKDFSPSALPRLISVYHIPSINVLQQTLSPWMDKVSTIGLSETVDTYKWLKGLNTTNVRISQLGAMQTPPFGRLHDGAPMWRTQQ